MSDLLRDVDYMRFYHTSEAANRDKDTIKNEAHIRYTKRVQALTVVPFGL